MKRLIPNQAGGGAAEDGGPGREAGGQLARLRARLAVADETLRAIRGGEVDSVMVAGKEGSQVFTLDGAESAYRILIESMNEGALILTMDKTVLYANQCFSRLAKGPLEQVTGGSLNRFLSAADRAALRPLLKRSAKPGSKIQVRLRAFDGTEVPVQISVRQLGGQGSNRASIGMVVTDMTEARRTEEMLRALTNRVVHVQEAERGRVALELHGHVTQLLCALLVRSQTLADRLPPKDGSARKEAVKLRELLGQAAGEVERISRHLRPSVLDELGLPAVLRDTSREFAKRMGIPLKLACVELASRLPADIELTFYRILQEALRNVEHHARAAHFEVHLTKRGGTVRLVVKDDGIGFDPRENYPAAPGGKSGLGLLGMKERIEMAGGRLQVESSPGHGATITAVIRPGPKSNSRRTSSQTTAATTRIPIL